MQHQINIEPTQTTLIPQKLFRPEWSERFAELNFKYIPQQQVVLSEWHEDLVFLSVIDKKSYENVQNQFPKGIFFSTYRILFLGFERIAKLDRKNRFQLFVNLASTTFDLFIFEKSRLLFANTFEIRTMTDFLYYLLQVVNRLKIDTGGLPIKVIDSAQKTESFSAVLEPHFSSVDRISQRDNPLNLRIPIEDGIFLVNPILCESSADL